MSVIVRFAPSPTGYLHIGSARTALFNYLYAKHTNGKFYLRIEDTDRERSTQEAVDALINGLEWLGLKHDGEIIYQHQRQDRHKEIAYELVKRNMAYFCYETTGELEALREEARKNKEHLAFRSKWRDVPADQYNGQVKPVIRLKVPNQGTIVVNDLVQGKVEVSCDQIDDLVLLRSDGNPTYMLACVVDDHDMGITHIIRGDDHLNNTPKQILLYKAMSWNIPEFAHIPLIHGDDGAKLSKRHGALGVEAYRDMGYLPEAMCNYLLRLGWSHGNDEIISQADAIKWFDVKDINKAPSRLDFSKMDSVNAHYLKNSSNQRLIELIKPTLSPTEEEVIVLEKAMDSLKLRAKTINDLVHGALYLIFDKIFVINEDAKNIIANANLTIANDIKNIIQTKRQWQKTEIETAIKEYCTKNGLKLGEVMQLLRALITGTTASISVFEIISILPQKIVLTRLDTSTRL